MLIPTLISTSVCICAIILAPDLEQTAKPSDFKLTLEQAVIASRKGDTEAARAIVGKFAKSKNQPHADILLATVLNKAGRSADARELLNNLAVREPDRLDVRMSFIGQAVLDQRWFDGLTHATVAVTAKVPANWDQAHTKSVHNELAWFKAVCHAGLGEWQKARTLALVVLKGSTPVADKLTFVARCEFELGNHDEAVLRFEQARELEPELPNPHVSLAELYGDNSTERERCYKKAITEGDDDDRVRSRLVYADWLVFGNRPEPVAEILMAPMKDQSADSQRMLLLGASARMKGDLNTARRYLTRLSQSDPTSFAPSNHLALVLIESDDEALRARALQIATTNVRNHPRLTETWATLGWIQYRLGDVSQAVQNLSKAASGGNISRDTAWYLSQVYGHLGNTAEQKKMLDAARTATGPVYVGMNKLETDG